MSHTEFKLKSPPEDAISSVKFGPNTNQSLLVGSWDCSVRLYDVTANTLRHKYTHDSPVLDVCFQDAVHSYSGGLDNTLKMYDFNSTAETVLGSHSKAVRCVDYVSEVNGIITGSWDGTIKLWDPRSPHCGGTYNCGSKVYAMSTCGEMIIVGTAGCQILVWDLRNMSYVYQRRNSSLQCRTRAIRCFPNKQGFVLCGIDGRVAVEYLDQSPEVQMQNYAFKCHRIKEGELERIYPVNAISFHSYYNTFATGGSDGYVNIWDGLNKRRLCQFHQYNMPITSLSFSKSGTALAIACTYLIKDKVPPNPVPDDAIYIRYVTDQETNPNKCIM